MKGESTGLKTRILQKNEKALFIHRYGHSTNLSVQDFVKLVQKIKDLLDTTYEVTTLIKKSPKRESMLEEIKDEVHSSTVHVQSAN